MNAFRLAEELDTLRHASEEILATLGSVEAERDALREAARALLAELESPRGDALVLCTYCSRESGPTPALAAWKLLCGHTACDEHKDRLHGRTAPVAMTYAAPLRALRALLGGDR